MIPLRLTQIFFMLLRLMIDWFRGEIPFLHAPIPSGRVLSIHQDGSIDWEAAKSIQCQGSFESSIRIKSSGGDGQGNATTLLVDGNLCKFLQGHNIFGSLDLNMLVYRTFEFIIASGFIELKIQTDLDSVFRNIEKGNYLVLLCQIITVSSQAEIEYNKALFYIG